MPANLCLTVRFLQPYSHGRGDGGVPEWPPSPLRVFQALIQAAAARWNERLRVEHAVSALKWLECQPSPEIVAPAAVRSEAKYRLYVPDNVADKVAKSWSGGREASIADYRTEKDVWPIHLSGADVHYLFPLGDDGPEIDKLLRTLQVAAQSITHVGWGVDMVTACAEIIDSDQAIKLTGDRWHPVEGQSGNMLRVPVEGTLDDLSRKHEAFLNRLSGDGFKPVPPLSAFRVIGYRRDVDPATKPAAAFSILKLDASGYRAFNAARQATVVAGMVRHALGNVANVQRPFGWNDEDIARIVLGHDANGRAVSEDPAEPRLSYLPLPTIEVRGSNNARHVGAIRRVLISGTPGMERELTWVRRALSGSELIREGADESDALLSTIPSNNFVVDQYLKTASIWTTVTPVILPGHDDRRQNKTERLLRKAMRQAGYAEELVQHAEIAWRSVGFLPGADLASRYRRPRNVSEAPVCHVRIQWRDAQGKPLSIAGPHAIGSGRFRGLGLMAAVD